MSAEGAPAPGDAAPSPVVPPVPAAHSQAFFAYLILTAVACGALVMVIEVLGSRIVGPLYGVSLFVWTSLITVTLVSLAGGYAVGGHLADRRGKTGDLYTIILAAGVLVLMVPLAKGPILKACLPLGLRGGAFVSSLILFGPSLFLLGCISPYLIKVAAREVTRIGRTVGTFYALSTLGSVVGTVATGFFLIGALGINQTLLATGCALIALAAGYFVLFRRQLQAAALAVVPLLFLPPGPPQRRTLPNGTVATVVQVRDGFYGNLKVVDYTVPGFTEREIVIDGLVQGGVDLTTGESVYPYPYYLEFIPLALHPAGRTCLVVGLGCGVIPRRFHQRGVEVDVVDIDPEVVDLAKRHLGFAIPNEVAIADARTYLAESEQRYDYLILDAFTGDTTPAHLLSVEALGVARDRLTERGVLAMNLAGSLERETFMTASVVRTLEELFDQVEVYPTFDRKETSGNLAVVAYQGEPRRFSPTATLQGQTIHYRVRADIMRNLGRRFRFPEGTPAIVLTDDYNPIDVYDTWLKERVRQTIIDGTDWDILVASE